MWNIAVAQAGNRRRCTIIMHGTSQSRRFPDHRMILHDNCEHCGHAISRGSKVLTRCHVSWQYGWGIPPQIALKHYLMTTDAHLDAAVSGKAAQKAAQNVSKLDDMELQSESSAHKKSPDFPGNVDNRNAVQLFGVVRAERSSKLKQRQFDYGGTIGGRNVMFRSAAARRIPMTSLESVSDFVCTLRGLINYY